MNKDFETRIKAVKTYLEGKHSLRKIALELKIPYQTVHRWVKWYKKGGVENLRRQYERHPRRAKKELEEEVVLLKEENPSLTMRMTKNILAMRRISISVKGIWGIWHRYGLSKRLTKDPTNPFGIATLESENGIKRAKYLLEKGEPKNAAKVLNELPSLPEDAILKEIPEKFLSSRRRLERLYLEFGNIPFPQYIRKVKQIRKTLERKRCFYSSIIADFFELHALGWMVKPESKIDVLNRLEKKMKGLRDNSLKFLFHCSTASNCYNLLEISKALKHTSHCRRLLYFLPYPHYWEAFGDLLTFAGKYKEAFSFYKKVLENEKESKVVEELFLKIALYGYNYSGHYSDCKKFLTKARALKNSVKYGATYSLISAYQSFGNGNLNEALHFFSGSLDEAYKGQLHNRIYGAALGLSAVAMALGKKNEAKIYLQKYLPLMRKYRLLTKKLILQSLINPAEDIKGEFNKILPICLLALLVKAKRTLSIMDYRKAFDFAKRQGLMGLFHRWVVFFPEVVLHLLDKGKSTGLPKAILQFPIFNKETPVYNIKFIGNLIIHKNQKHLGTKLQPKDTAFLIQLALKAGEPRREIPLEKIYNNFWKDSKNPSQNLSHLLVRVKKTLKIPSYLLEVSHRKDNSVLKNVGIHFVTDYDEYQQSLAQAKALLRAGEWGFAKREFMQAFSLFKGEPFKKMYDDWSDDKRLEILFNYETEVLAFAKELRKRGRTQEAEKLLKRAEKIIPDIRQG